MSDILISVIVPFYNEEKHIRECAASLINQSFDKDRHEIIFIDNHSIDKSKDIIWSFPEIRYLFEQERGRYAARNRGLSVAKGSIIAFTDSDCAVDTHWLESIYEALSQNETQIILGSNIYSNPKSLFAEFWELNSNERIKFFLSKELKHHYYAYTSNMAIKRQVFEDVGFFNQVRGEDTEYLMRCLKVYPHLNIKYVDSMIVTRLDRVSLHTLMKKHFKYGYNKIVFLKKHEEIRKKRRIGGKNIRLIALLKQFLSNKKHTIFQAILLRLSIKLMEISWNTGCSMGWYKLMLQKHINHKGN